MEINISQVLGNPKDQRSQVERANNNMMIQGTVPKTTLAPNQNRSGKARSKITKDHLKRINCNKKKRDIKKRSKIRSTNIKFTQKRRAGRIVNKGIDSPISKTEKTIKTSEVLDTIAETLIIRVIKRTTGMTIGAIKTAEIRTNNTPIIKIRVRARARKNKAVEVRSPIENQNKIQTENETARDDL